MIPFLLAFPVFVIALAGAVLFAYLETTVTALRLFQINHLESVVLRYKRLFALWRSAPEQILITILIASNFADVVCSVLLTHMIEENVAGTLGTVTGVLASTVLIVVVGNIVPKSYARIHAHKTPQLILFILNTLITLLRPFMLLYTKINQWCKPTSTPHEHDVAVSEQEIAFLINYSDQKGIMEPHKSEMLQNIFGLSHTKITTIMTPASSTVMLEKGTTLAQAYDVLINSSYTRVPVYERSPSYIIGFIHQKDVFAHLLKEQSGTIDQLIRPIMHIKHTKKISLLLKDFLKTQSHLAVVTNDRNGAIGIITLEDVLEEIVGEITDEHDEELTH